MISGFQLSSSVFPCPSDINAINSLTNNRYNGINQFMLSFKSESQKYKNNI